VEINLNYWQAAYDGKIKLEEFDILGVTVLNLGQSLEFQDDLGIENPQWTPEIEIKLNLGDRLQIIVSYFHCEYFGSERLDTNIEFAGYQFPINTKFDTSFKFERFKVIDVWKLVSNETVEFSFLTGVEYYNWRFDYDGRETTTTFKIGDDIHLAMPIPVLGVEGSLHFGGGFGIHGSFSGMAFGYGGYMASYTDLDAGLYWQYEMINLGVGYRATHFLVTGKDWGLDFEWETNQDGILITAGVAF